MSMLHYDPEQRRRDIRFGVLAILVAFIILAVGECAQGAECLPSARAVWDAHPGSHATWSTVDDRRCWRVGYGKLHRKEVMQIGGRSGSTPSLSKRLSTFDDRPPSATAAVPMPRDKPWKLVLFNDFLDFIVFGSTVKY